MSSSDPLGRLLLALETGDLPAAREAARALGAAESGTRQLAAEVLHEIKQPLLGIKAYAQMLDEAPAAKGSRSPVGLLLSQVERIEQIIGDFTRLANSRPAPKERLRLATVVTAAASAFALHPDAPRITLDLDLDESVELVGNPRLLEQLTWNLINNAREAMGGRGRIKVVVSRKGALPVLCVADWGPGIPPEIRARIFEPYVSTRSRGSGLGLAVCQRIAQEHRAELTLASPEAVRDKPAPATVFQVLFPLAESAAAPVRKKVLVVDDEEIIRWVFRDLLGRECELIDVGSAEEAIQHLERGPVDLIVTDKNLPGLSGLELAQRARELDPRSRVILMTGYPSLVTAQQALELGLLDYLVKPFDEIREVREKIRQALARTDPGRKVGTSRRIDVYEDEPISAAVLSEALGLLGLEPNVMTSKEAPSLPDPPLGILVSWDFGPAWGKEAVQLGRELAHGVPFVVLVEHLTMDNALEALRGGATACLPKVLGNTRALSRELSRALKLGSNPN